MGRILRAAIGFGLLVFLAACSSAPAPAPTAAVGTLQVDITGLPSGVNASVKVAGAGFTQDLTSSQTLGNRAVGNYTVSAASVTSGGVTYNATVSGSPATVIANATSTVTVTYTINPANLGSVAVNITGLPVGGAANVLMTGPGGFSQTITNSTTVGNLVPGSYSFTANNIPGAGATANFSFGGTVVGSPANVIAGSSTSINISYITITGSLGVVVNSSLPQGLSPDITVRGPNGFSRSITTSTTLPNLAPGAYTLEARNLRIRQTTVDGQILAFPPGATRVVLAGESAEVRVSYVENPLSGQLFVPTTTGTAFLPGSDLATGGAKIFESSSFGNTSVAVDREGRTYFSNNLTNTITIADFIAALLSTRQNLKTQR